MIYLTADTHFGHKNIIGYCNRPFKDTYLMNKALTENWNAVVTPEDTVYHLGDFAFGGIRNYLPHLNGNIILIRGNHDRDTDIRNCGIVILPYLDLEYGGYRFKLNHRPQFLPNTPDPYNDSEHRHPFDFKQFDWLLCGHVHEKWTVMQRNINVGVDVREFKPVAFDKIIEDIKKIEEYKK